MLCHFDGLELGFDLLERAHSTEPYEDWIRLGVTVKTRTFHGAFDWSITSQDLRTLRDYFSRFYDQVGREQILKFEPVEPNVEFVFRAAGGGNVEVDYKFQGELAWGPTLTGSCSFDQSHIPEILTQLDDLLAKAVA